MTRILISAAAMVMAGLIALPARAADAPFGDKVSARIVNYNRAAPAIGSAGKLDGGGVAEAKALGFVTIVDLRGATEGTAEERAEAEKVGIAYRNIEVVSEVPSADQVAAFAAIIEDAANQPVLFHCVSANRAGAMWALYRASRGVPAGVALEEGRTLGLHGAREDAVRAELKLPPPDKTTQ